MLALAGGEDFSHDDGWCNAPPIFSFRLRRKEKTGRARSKREKPLGRECARSGKFRPNAGVFSDGARKFAGLNPAASDSVPPFGALPQQVPSRLFCIFDAGPLAPLPALRAYSVPCGRIAGFTRGGQRSSVRPTR